MAADIHTKAYPDKRAGEWEVVRTNVNVLKPSQFKSVIGRPGNGYLNRIGNPENYVKPDVTSDPWAMLGPATSDAAGPIPRIGIATHSMFKDGGGRLSMAADCVGLGSAVEAVVGISPWM